jgi:DeoR family fructose operon transcriptional repressor
MSPANSRGQPDPQLASARQSAILAALRGRGHVKAVQIADEFGVTHETIRKDLMLLESHRLLRRVHGGAMPVESLSFEPCINERTTMAAEKKRIATAAADLLPRSGAVLFDSGTTTAALAANLPRESSLVTVTNSLPIALELRGYPQLTVHMLGGQIRSATSATVDWWALRHLREVRTDIAFVGTNAFSLSHGLSAPDAAEAAVKGAMVESARLIVLLADHTKFGREAMFRYADLRAIDVLVTDDGMSESDARSLMTAADIEVLRV